MYVRDGVVRFRGYLVAASLKLRSACPPGAGGVPFPRLSGRGLIEARVHALYSLRSLKFPRLSGRGLIEAVTTAFGAAPMICFRGYLVAASLKPRGRGHMRNLLRGFRGYLVAASLMQQV